MIAARPHRHLLTKTVWSRLGGEHYTARGNRDLQAPVRKDRFALTCIGDAGRRVVELDSQGAAPAGTVEPEP